MYEPNAIAIQHILTPKLTEVATLATKRKWKYPNNLTSIQSKNEQTAHVPGEWNWPSGDKKNNNLHHWQSWAGQCFCPLIVIYVAYKKELTDFQLTIIYSAS